MDLALAIRSRRTIKQFSGEPLSRGQVEALLGLASWAPNHRRTRPWRFHACDQAAVRSVGERLATDPALAPVLEPRKAAKIRELLAGAGAMVLVTWLRNPDPVIDREDLAATAAAVQNLLLAATDAGLGSFWSTNPGLAHPAILAGCGIDTGAEGFLGAIILGRAAEAPAAPAHPPLADRLRWVVPRW